MATPVTISAYVAQARAQGVTFADLLVALQYMAISAIADDLGRVTATGSDGTSISFSSMDALFAAMDMCRKIMIQDQGPQILNSEFAPAGNAGYSGGWSA